MTTFPPRIDKLVTVLESVLAQSYLPSKIVICLYRNEFKKIKFSSELNYLLDIPNIEIIWTDENIMPHKKYFYAMQKYKNKKIITIDDDCIIKKSLFEKLIQASEKFEKCVICTRSHRINIDENNNIKKYKEWEYETCYFNIPSHKLVATGVGGILYPPNALPKEAFDINLIKKLCLKADDIWLKAMEIKNNVKVVNINRINNLVVGIENAEEINLVSDNVQNCQNDIYVNTVFKYFNIKFDKE